MDSAIEDIHQFWFGELDEQGFCAPSFHSLWFKKSDATDRHCREQFGPWVERAIDGELAHWKADSRSLIALILLLDQFTRNIYRDSAEAFAGDAQALAAATACVDSGRHLQLPPIHRVFLYMPLEHSEDLETQQRCVALFEALATETGDADIAGFGRYAVAHRDVIAQFGRFPHRNAVLGRESTAAEIEYLNNHGGF